MPKMCIRDRYTEDTLLSAMETAGNEDFDEDTEKKGLGTPATRASMIEKLVSSRYLERKGKQLIPTDAGINLIDILPEKVKSAKMTAEWENALMEMERGKVRSEKFLADIDEWVHQLIRDFGEVSEEEKKRFASERKGKEQDVYKRQVMRDCVRWESGTMRQAMQPHRDLGMYLLSAQHLISGST